MSNNLHNIIISLKEMGYLLYKLLLNPFRDTVIHRCGNCSTILKPGQKTCPRCSTEIDWS